MAQLTLLEMVQDILSDMNSDEANSVTDTIESMQVARIVKSCYMEMMANKNWPHLKKLTTLESVSDPATPTHLKMPSDVKELHSVEYNRIKSGETRQKWEEIDYLTPDAFLRMVSGYNSDNSNVQSVTDFGGSTILIKNDTPPSYYTSFDDNYLVFNSFDSVVDTTLQGSKSRVHITESPTFTIQDSFVPQLPEEGFSALLAEAKSACFARLKEMEDAKSEQQAQRSARWMSRKNWRAGGGIKFPDYGR